MQITTSTTRSMNYTSLFLLGVLHGTVAASRNYTHSIRSNSGDVASNLRGASRSIEQSRRRAGPKDGHHSSSSSSSSYVGCLGLSDEELADTWNFQGDAPSCSYVVSDGGGGDNDDSANDGGSSGSGSNGDDSGSGGSNESGNGSDGNGGDEGDDEYGSGNGDGDGDNDSSNGGDGNSDDDGDGNDGTQNENGGDNGDGDGDEGYDVVVSNEDASNGTDYNAYEDFNVSRCETYTNLWVWDLAMSCEDSVSFESCNCSFAEELMGVGLLDCGDESECPDDCPVCRTCLSLLGCNVTGNIDIPSNLGRGETISSRTIMYIVAAAVLVFILAIAIYCSRRNSSKGMGDLSADLMAGETTDMASQQSGVLSPAPSFEPPVDLASMIPPPMDILSDTGAHDISDTETGEHDDEDSYGFGGGDPSSDGSSDEGSLPVEESNIPPVPASAVSGDDRSTTSQPDEEETEDGSNGKSEVPGDASAVESTHEAEDEASTTLTQ